MYFIDLVQRYDYDFSETMVRHYKRKTERGPDPNNLKAALELVKQGKAIQKLVKGES